jgi:riboflavin kinase/FMN adenylyltransferase
MQVCRGFDEAGAVRGGVVAIGNFDGVHLGHRAMIAETVRLAREQAVPAVALTFDPHPVAILRGSAPPALTTTERKLELLAGCGLDATIVFPTDWAFLQLTPEAFFERIVQQTLQARGLVEGPNFRFGHNRAGDIETLHRLCDGAGLEFVAVPAVNIDGRIVSSSEIRQAITRGDIPSANAMLGSDYRLQGRVVEGAKRGRTIEFPTANLDGVTTLLPPEGVYAGRAWLWGQPYAAGLNLGPNPTFAEQARKLEVHLLDFTGDLYGQTLDVDLLARLRDTRPFASVDELKAQLAKDMAQVRKLCEQTQSKIENPKSKIP